MGCSTSKLDDLPAVALCRDRCGFLEAAIHQRHALAESHVAYTQSLRVIAQSLHHFILHHHGGEESLDDDDGSPKKPKPKPKPAPPHPPLAHSDSDSGHIEFDSDSDDIDSDHSSPLHHHLDDEMMGPPPPPSYPSRYLHMNYMKNSSMPPSVVYEQRPSSPHRVFIGESSSSSSPYFGYPSYRPGSPSPSKQPQPPSPPRSTGWDFLNPFDSYYAPYSPSQDSRELREEEDIPDLEEDDFHHEVVKEVQGKQKLVAAVAVDDREEPSTSGGQASMYQTRPSTSGGQASLFQNRPSVSVEREEKEYDDVHVVEKKVVEKDGGDEAPRSNAVRAFRGGVPEIAKEIEAQFLRASEAGSEIAVMLELAKHPRDTNHASLKTVASSSQPSTSKKAKASYLPPTYADIEAELALRSRNLSSTLRKLHLWEKKLYDEVKAEEKLRVSHERKLRKLKHWDERGAVSQKVDSTRILVRTLSTKIRIAIRVVDKVSVTINTIRDEELWPQLSELIKGLSRMWKSMAECHRSQYEAIKVARGLGHIRASHDHLEATRMLGRELINWVLGFSSWVGAQKGFVRELNSWLMKCLIYEPEETADGFAPFSPGRMGAPLVFVICNQWEQAMDRISEKEVVEAMRSFATSVLHLWEQDSLETPGHGEEQRVQKEIQELERKMLLVGPGLEDNIVYQSDTSNVSLQGSLRRIFEAMERFAVESLKAYEDLLERVTEEEIGSPESEEE